MSGNLGLFFGQLLRNPKRISAIAPSSKGLARKMVSQIDADTGEVVEIGAGTGAITRFILGAGVAPADLSIVEMNPEFCTRLQALFPGCDVRQMDAQNLADLPRSNVGTVISGLPLLSIPEEIQQNIIQGAFDLMRPGGKYVQFTYGPKPPIAPSVRESVGLEWRTLPKVWLNLPPATTYIFTKKA